MDSMMMRRGRKKGKKTAMNKKDKLKEQNSDEKVGGLDAIKIDPTDVLFGKVAEGDDIPFGAIRAIVFGTDNVHNILARKNELRTTDLYVQGCGFDARPCSTLYLLLTNYFLDKMYFIENMDSKGDKISVAANKQRHIIFDLMNMCMGFREKIRFSAIMDENEFNQFKQVFMLLRDNGQSDDIIKECGNNIPVLISKLSLSKDGTPMFSRSRPKREF